MAGGLSTFSIAQNNRLWATYYGETSYDFGYSVATDVVGNIYLAGITASVSGIASGGFQNTIGGGSDAFLVKFNASGIRLWATYYGGTGAESASSVATDAVGNVYLAGITTSTIGIASSGFQNIYGGSTIYGDAFLVKFDVSGTRLWATYYGGTGDEMLKSSVATDAVGNVYLAGITNSTSGMTSGGFQNIYGGGSQDAFVVKFSTSGSRLWATYYGGASTDYGNSITTDASGNVYLAGQTGSTSGIASGGFQNVFGGGASFDAFLVKFDATTGNRLWGTYYGTTNYDAGNSVAADATGNIYLAGNTTSISGIASGGFQNIYGGASIWTGDAFLVKFNSAGTRLWATYYGGTDDEETSCVATDALGNVYLAGETYSASGLGSGGFQNNMIGSENQFLVAFDASGNRLCATYYGQNHEEDIGVAVDKFGHVYMTGSTNSFSGIVSGGFQNIYGGGSYDAYLVKFTSCIVPLSVNVVSTNINCNDNCTGTGMATPSGGISPYIYSWNTIPIQTTQIATGLCATTYTVTVTDMASSTISVNVTITEKYCEELYIPNSFTPNSDNKNDVFLPVIDGVQDFNMLIYNRWGELIFESNNISKGWDGRYKGRNAQEDVYVYVIVAIDYKNEKQHYFGRVTLIR